jgi:hypothetical protein
MELNEFIYSKNIRGDSLGEMEKGETEKILKAVFFIFSPFTN